MAEIRGLVGTGRRESFTFRPSIADELIRVYKIDGCIGDTKLKQIQIEEGRRATDFVAPSFVESQVSGLFKDLRDIRVRMDDPNSELWGKIHANNEALLVEYHNGRLSSKLGISPEQHIQAFRDELSGDYATFEQRLNGMQTNIRNGAEQYTDTALANLKRTEIQSLDGRISTATQTLDAHATRLQGVEGSVSSHTQTLRGFQNKLEDAEGNISTNTQLINGFNRRVEDVDGRITQVSETIDGVRTTVRDEANSYTDTELAKLRRTEIQNIQGSVSTMEQSIENFRQTLRTASGDFSQVEQTIRGIREEFEAADREVQASFERTFEGMETRIKNANESYTDTAIAGLKQTEIKSLDGRVTTATQTVDGFSRRIRDAEGAISSVRQSVQGFDQRIQGVEGSYSQLSQTVGGLTTAVNGHNGLQSRVTQLADQLSSKVSSDDFSTHLSQYSDTIWAAVRNRVPSSSGKMTGSEIISAIRLDRSGVKISGSKVQITGDTSIDNAVIKSGHIHSLNADKITTGTLNAARVRVINLDANNITGNKTNFVQSNWNNINDRVQITSAGIEMINSGAWRKTIYTATGLEMFRGRGAGDNAGVIGYFKGSDYHANDEEYFMDGFGDHHTIGIGAYGQIALGTGNDTSIRKFEPKMVINQKFDGIQTNKIAALKTEAGFTISAGTARGEWASILAGSLNRRNRLTFAQSIATLEANDKLDFYASAGARVMRLTYKSVDINGSIKYSSDARLKTNIKKSKQNSLSQILNIEYTNFDWKDGSTNQFGFIAQQVQQSASELITTDSEDYLRYDETRYVHTIGHALQQSHEQLLERIENLEEENKKLKEQLDEAV
ncbi:gp58-like family protein [Dolosigranulum pigrum]